MITLESGYQKATSQNLPNVDLEMLSQFIYQNENLSAENRCVKATKSARASYGDLALEWVQIRRDGSTCLLKARICPEHKVHSKSYAVSAAINESEEEIENAQCHDCLASEGGCKHAIALVAWLYRRSCEPSSTSVECYWKKSALSRIGSQIKSIKINEMSKRRKEDQENVNPGDSSQSDEAENLEHRIRSRSQRETGTVNDRSFLDAVLTRGIEKNCDNHLVQFYRHTTLAGKASMHNLATTYCGDTQNADDFIEFCEKSLTNECCREVEKLTRNQSEAPQWYQHRYGRITASIAYEAASCQTIEGSLVEKIMGAKTVCTEAMMRGKKLEASVVKQVEKDRGIRIRPSGLLLSPKCLCFGASPDGLTDSFVIEIKCPSKREALFCIAYPHFEENKVVTTWIEPFDTNFLSIVMKGSMNYWKCAVFPKLMISANR